jgi:hypothetical protein
MSEDQIPSKDVRRHLTRIPPAQRRLLRISLGDNPAENEQIEKWMDEGEL